MMTMIDKAFKKINLENGGVAIYDGQNRLLITVTDRSILTYMRVWFSGTTGTVTKTTLPDGTVETRDADGYLHSVNDEPAVVRADGSKTWFCHGLADRHHDLPAHICADGTQEWYAYSFKHRYAECVMTVTEDHDEYEEEIGDLPAVVHPDGRKEYWKWGKLQR